MIPSSAVLDAAAGICLAALWRASWQGGLVLAGVWALTRTLPKMPAELRAWLWRLSYLKLALSLVWAGCVTLAVLPAPSPSASAQRHPARVLDRNGRRAPVASTDPGGWSHTVAPLLQPETKLPRTAVRAGLSLLPRVPAWRWGRGLLLLWSIGVALSLARLWVQYRRVRQLRRACTPLDDGPCREVLRELGVRAGMRRLPELVTGPAGTPQLTGVLRPLLVVPPHLPESVTPAELRLIMAHELAHLRRNDLAWGWLTAAVEALCFFHPLLWLTRRDRRLAVELACDELSLRITRARPGEYGAMLVRLAAQRRELSFGFGTLHVLEPLPHLERRLALLQYINRRSLRSPLQAGAVAALTALGILTPWRIAAQAAPRTSATTRAVPNQHPIHLAVTETPRAEVEAPAAAKASRTAGPATGTAKAPAREETAKEARNTTRPANTALPASPGGAPAAKSVVRADETAPSAGEAQQALPVQSSVDVVVEDTLLLEAARYLQLSTSQLQALLSLARGAEERVGRLNAEERKLGEAVQRLAQRQREALLKGQANSSQDEADLQSLRQIIQRKRAEAEDDVLKSVLPKLAALLSQRQVEREYLLQRGIQPPGETVARTLLDPQAGFVLAAPTAQSPAAPRPESPLNVRPAGSVATTPPTLQEQLTLAQAMDKQLRAQLDQMTTFQNANLVFTQENDGAYLKVPTSRGERIVSKYPANTAEPVAREHFQRMQDKMRDDLVARFNDNTARVEVLRRDVSAGGAGSRFTSPEAAEILRPLARRLFFSPRFRPVLEERLGKG